MIKEQCKNTNHTIYNEDLIEFLFNYKLPEYIYLNNADSFDDKYISTQESYWVYDYSGSRHCVRFDFDKNSNKLLKFICFHYASTRSPYQLPSLQQAWVKAIDYCKRFGIFNFSLLKDYLETDNLEPRSFYYIIYGIKILCIYELSDFSLSNYDDLEFIPRPINKNWGVYKEIDNILDKTEKNMISKGLLELANAIKNGVRINKNKLKNAAMLGVIYATGARPVQISKLAAKDIYIDTRDLKNNISRYSIFLPYAKQRQITTERIALAIPPEIGILLLHYRERAKLKPDQQLFNTGTSAPFVVSKCINQAILEFSPSEYQEAVARGEAAKIIITPTDFRHNVGHSLAMQGASAEEISHILGHSSLVVAKHYISATPSLALIRARALGSNLVWKNMISMMLTGKLYLSQQWKGRRVVGIVGDKLHTDLGGCSREDMQCPFSEVRCCYSCLYYHPFIDGKHHSLLKSIIKEQDELLVISDSVGNSCNPLIEIHAMTSIEIQSVITRCELYKSREQNNEKKY